MSVDKSQVTSMDLDTAFLKSRRGILKAAQMGTLFVAFVCFAAAARPKYIAATVLEFVITMLLVFLYVLRLNKRLTFFFWPLVDMFNSVFAAVFFIVLSLLAVTTYTVTGTLVGGLCSLFADRRFDLGCSALCGQLHTFQEHHIQQAKKRNPGSRTGVNQSLTSTSFLSLSLSLSPTMGDIEAPTSTRPRQTVLLSVLPSKEFASSKKGMLLIAEVALSFIAFVCFAASAAAGYVTVPLLGFVAALFFLFAYSTKFNERFKGFLWPLSDFLRCVISSIVLFIVSILAVYKFADGSSKAAGVKLTVPSSSRVRVRSHYCVRCRFLPHFNELANFLKQGGESTDEPSRQQDDFSDSDSD
ncbi:hypothetical protein INR49_003121 [Caranx melampygus]|nr:hypothetical protein INR49_003121 [Caranx melampygus]